MLDIDKFCTLRPTLYHLAAEGSWPSIRQHGLLSSQEILGKFSSDLPTLQEIEDHRRTKSYFLRDDDHGTFVLRDRRPLNHAKLKQALEESLTVAEWIDLLNQRVFFFAQKKSLDGLSGSAQNRKLSHLILEVNTRRLFNNHANSIHLADINTGSTLHRPAPRGPRTFQSPATYIKTGARQIVEVTVLKSVPDILSLLNRAVLRNPSGAEQILYSI